MNMGASQSIKTKAWAFHEATTQAEWNAYFELNDRLSLAHQTYKNINPLCADGVLLEMAHARVLELTDQSEKMFSKLCHKATKHMQKILDNSTVVNHEQPPFTPESFK